MKSGGAKSNLRLIVVDDEAPMRGLLHDFLTSQGFNVDCFSTAGAALKHLRSPQLSVGVIIADIRMVPIDGFTLLETVKKDHPEVPVVLFTSAGTPEQRDFALSQGAFHYMVKPFALADLKIIIERAFKVKAKKTD